MAKVTILAGLHRAQQTIHDSSARYKVVDAGRRFGKTRLGVMECIDCAVHGRRAWWIAPTYRVSDVGWRPLRQLAARIPGVQVRLADRIVSFPGGGEVAVRSSDAPDSLRGEGLDYVVMDEAAFMSRDVWSQAIRPALADRRGHALFISTPKGRNWFWEIYQRGVSGDPGWSSFSYPTSANPFIDPREIDAARGELPEITFRQEFGAEFVDSSGDVFRRVHDAACLQPLDGPVHGHQYVCGVDVAASVDYTVATVMDVADRCVVYQDRFNRIDFPVLEDRLAAIYKKWNIDTMMVESNSIGQAVIDHLNGKGLLIQSFTTTSATKAAIIQHLQAAFEHDEIKIIDDPISVGELLSFTAKRSASGNMQYGAPEGVHDDTVMSLAITWSMLTTGQVFI